MHIEVCYFYAFGCHFRKVWVWIELARVAQDLFLQESIQLCFFTMNNSLPFSQQSVKSEDASLPSADSASVIELEHTNINLKFERTGEEAMIKRGNSASIHRVGREPPGDVSSIQVLEEARASEDRIYSRSSTGGDSASDRNSCSKSVYGKSYPKPYSRVLKIYLEATPYLMEVIESRMTRKFKGPESTRKLLDLNKRIRKLNVRYGYHDDDFLIDISWFEIMALKCRDGPLLFDKTEEQAAHHYISQKHYPEGWWRGLVRIFLDHLPPPPDRSGSDSNASHRRPDSDSGVIKDDHHQTSAVLMEQLKKSVEIIYNEGDTACPLLYSRPFSICPLTILNHKNFELVE